MPVAVKVNDKTPDFLRHTLDTIFVHASKRLPAAASRKVRERS